MINSILRKLILFLCFLAAIATLENYKKYYEKDYFAILGFDFGITTIKDVHEQYGLSLNSFFDDDNKLVEIYDDFTIKYELWGPKTTRKYKIRVLTVTGGNYTFGKRKIGIGSTKEEVIKAYRNVPKIKEEEVGEGYVDKGRTFITFYYDDNDRVKSIEIIPDGP